MKLSIIAVTLSVISSAQGFSVLNGEVKIPKPVQQLGTAVCTLATTLTVASNVAMATPADVDMGYPTYASTSSSTIILSGSTDPFAMPSYSEATKNKNIEVDLDSINQNILDKAEAARNSKDVDKANNESFIDLRKLEREEEERMQRLRELAKQERAEAIAKEKAETKANRWNTF